MTLTAMQLKMGYASTVQDSSVCVHAQSAEEFRKRALEGIRVIGYLQEFAAVSDLSQLSDLFQDDNRLAEAAVRTTKSPF